MKNSRRGIGRQSRSTFTTKSGKSIKVNRSLSDKIKAHKDFASRLKAERLSGMPKGHIQRLFYRLHPKRLYKYWFSREGAVMALKIAGVGLVTSFLLVVGVFAYFRKDLPNIKDISGSNLGGTIEYYDRTGQTLLFADSEGVKRIPVQGDQMSQFMKDATIAVEDKDFFHHSGFDTRGILRASINNTLGKSDSKQGGSTITQQLVRLTQKEVGNQQTIQRKIKELILSVELERSYSKQDILTGYLNAAPYGNIQYGVEAAARDYFQKGAKDLTLDEAAFLAGIPKAPSFYSPYGPDYDTTGQALTARQHYILGLMRDQHMITDKQHDEAIKVNTVAHYKQPKQKYEGIRAPYFVLSARDQLHRKFSDSVKQGGWKVITTVDLNLQTLAEQNVQKGLAQVRRQGGDQVAFAAEDVKTGQVVALVGGVDFNNKEYGEFNYASQPLPPGSSFKPYDYTSLIENSTNAGAGSVLYDTQGPLGAYQCIDKSKPSPTGDNSRKCLWDYDFRYPGPLTLRYALGASRNVPAVKAMLITGVDKTIDTAHKLMTNYKDDKPEEKEGRYACYEGGTSEFVAENEAPCGPSSAIGDGAYLDLDKHVHGFASISRNGLNLPQTYVLKIFDSNNKVIDEWKPSKGNQAVRPDAAYIVADMISDPNASYLLGSKKSHRYTNKQGTWKFGMKTGTTNDSKDGWMMGFSTQYAAGVWVGYHNRNKMLSGFMEDMTQPIWNGWMKAAHENLKPEERARPAGIQVLPAFVVRTKPSINGEVVPSPATDLYPSWYQANKTSNQKQTLDIVSNKLATSCTPARAKKEVTGGSTIGFSIDKFVGGGGSNTDATDDIHKCGEAQPAVQIVGSPPSCSGSCNLSLSVVAGAHPLSSEQFKGTLNVIIAGQIVQSAQVDNAGAVNLSFSYNGSGDQTVTIQIIDSVLYEGTSNPVTINFLAAAAPTAAITITDPTPGEAVGSGATTSMSWSGGTPGYSVSVNGTPQPQCSGSVTTCSLTLPPGSPTYIATVSDSAGRTASVSFKK